MLVNEHHPALALRMLNDVPPSDPLAPVVQLRRVALIDGLGRSDDAMRELERLAREYPDSPLPDEQLGDILRTKQRFPDAVAAYDRAIARVASRCPPTGSCSTTVAWRRSARTTGPRPRPISITRWNCRRTSRSC